MSFGRFEDEDTPEEDKGEKGIFQNNDNYDSIKNNVEECYKLLEEISVAASTPIYITKEYNLENLYMIEAKPHHSATLDNRVRKIANSLLETLNKFKYSESYSIAIQSAITKSSKLSK
jgi:hypothetical protein